MKDSTERKVLHAFNQLLNEMEFHRINVRTITQKADISRATFYRHFKDKYDVMNYNYTCILNDSLTRMTYASMKQLFEQLLLTGKENGSTLLPLFATDGPNSFHAYIARYSYITAANIYERRTLDDSLPVYRRLNERNKIQLQVFCHGAAWFFESWIKGNMACSAREAAQILYEILPEFMKGDLWRSN